MKSGKQHVSGFESTPLSDGVQQQVRTERGEAVLTGSCFSLPPDQCKGTAGDLTNNAGEEIVCDTSSSTVQRVPLTSLNNQRVLTGLNQPTVIKSDSCHKLLAFWNPGNFLKLSFLAKLLHTAQGCC